MSEITLRLPRRTEDSVAVYVSGQAGRPFCPFCGKTSGEPCDEWLEHVAEQKAALVAAFGDADERIEA